MAKKKKIAESEMDEKAEHKKKGGGLAGAKAMTPTSSPSMPDPKWQIEEDARTMMRHGEIMQDPKRHAASMKHLSGQKEAITSVEQLKKRYQELAGPKKKA